MKKPKVKQRVGLLMPIELWGRIKAAATVARMSAQDYAAMLLEKAMEGR